VAQAGAAKLGTAMKVVVAHNRYVSSQPSGENTIVAAEIAQLTAAGITVLPVQPSSDDIAALPAVRKALLPLSPIYNHWAVQDIDRLIEAERPDVLHVHNPYPLLSPAIIRTAARRDVPVVHTVHNFRQVCVSGTYFRDGHLCQDCKGRSFGWPGVQHACYRGSRPQSLLMATALARHRRTWRTIPHYIALTDAIAAHLTDYGVPAERITVKPNGVEDPGPPPAEPGDGFAFVGRLTAEKGVQLLLDAWSQHPDGSLGPLRIVGDGPLRGAVDRAAADRGDLTALGQVPPAEVRRQIRASAALIVPSTWPDVLPTVIIEALANGRPTLGTDVGGIPYLIGDTGWTVAPIADALAAALPQVRAAAADRSSSARARYEAEFTPEVNVARLIELYNRVKRP
jgi:glycosyltransferase involved in cell wall biosynthesis